MQGGRSTWQMTLASQPDCKHVQDCPCRRPNAATAQAHRHVKTVVARAQGVQRLACRLAGRVLQLQLTLCADAGAAAAQAHRHVKAVVARAQGVQRLAAAAIGAAHDGAPPAAAQAALHPPPVGLDAAQALHCVAGAPRPDVQVRLPQGTDLQPAST